MKGTDHYAELLGIKVLEIKDGYCKVEMRIGKQHTNAMGCTHGGAIFSLADYAFAEACNFGDNIAVGIQVDIKYLRPTTEGDVLIAEAKQISDGKTTGVYQVLVYKEDKLTALFSAIAFKK
jgi:acyl-CoA thioesterase